MPLIKVLHLITKLEFGGAQQNTLFTTANLNRTQFDVTLASGKGGYLDSRAKSQTDYRVVWLKYLKREIRPWRDIAAFFEILSTLKKIKPHIIHTHSSKGGILGRWAAWIAKVPIIIHTYHGFGFHDFQPALIRGFYSMLERMTGRITTQIIYVSKNNMDYAARYKIRAQEPPQLIRSGVVPPKGSYPMDQRAKEMKRKQLGLPVDSLLVTTIGNLKSQKNPGHFLELAKKIHALFPKARFLFIGGSEMRTQSQTFLTEHGHVPSNLSYLGWREDAQSILETSDLFVLTSLWEGLPRSAVEALWRGIPVCAYATDGLKEVVRNGENGYLVGPGKLDQLSDRIFELLQNEVLRDKIARQASRSVGEEFDIYRMVNQQETLYQDLVRLIDLK